MLNPQSESERISPTIGLKNDRLVRVQEVWDAQAQSDPLWAVLSDPERMGRRWDLDTFMATGREQVAGALRRFEELGGTFADRDLALDFGSGVGRLSQALGKYFDTVVGLDISPTMISVANRINQSSDRVSYRLNESSRLESIENGTVTLVFSYITLQHLPSDVARSYLEEFFRVLKPGGGVIFQMPSHYSENYLPAARDDCPVPAELRKVAINIHSIQEPLIAGKSVELQVDVTNLSGGPWTQSAIHPLHVGNHWLNTEGVVVEWNDGRVRLPGLLPPEETARVAFTVTAPAEAGDYLLQADVVQEGVTWFRDSSASEQSPEIAILVLPGSKEATAPDDSEYFGTSPGHQFHDLITSDLLSPPEFDMNAIPRSEVEALIARGGARLLGADEWVNEWHSYTYYVQARS